MSTLAKNTKSTIVACMRYRDATKAVAWLCETFGFERHMVVPGPDGAVMHAELSYGNGLIMLGPVVANEFGKNMKQPDEIGGCETQCVYAIAADADKVYARAKAAGCAMLVDIKDEDYGGRGFTCRDFEGHIWSFGTYDPWSVPK